MSMKEEMNSKPIENLYKSYLSQKKKKKDQPQSTISKDWQNGKFAVFKILLESKRGKKHKEG